MSQRRVQGDMAAVVPGGILESDHWHLEDVDAGTCSRCGLTPPEDEKPLLIHAPGRRAMLRYCANCTEIGA